MRASGFDSADWRDVLARFGGEAGLARSARAHGAFLRAREVERASDLLRLALMYGPGGLSLRSLAATAAAEGLCELSDVALLKRLRKSSAWIEALCGDLLSGAPEPGPLADSPAPGRARPIRIVDASRIEGPGGEAWRLHLAFDPAAARVTDARFTRLDQGERLDRLAPEPGAIYLADRGYPQPDGLGRLIGAGADVLVRLTWNSLRLRDPQGQPLDWAARFVEAHARGGLDMSVTVHKPRAKFAPLPMRLVMIPKPPEAALRARASAQKASRKDQRRQTNPLTLEAADHLIVLTSLSAEAFSMQSLAALYRLRWQIELAFKRLKSLLHIDRLPAKGDALASTWLHAHLMLALLIDAEAIETGAFPP